jgi:hypothetical protein
MFAPVANSEKLVQGSQERIPLQQGYALPGVVILAIVGIYLWPGITRHPRILQGPATALSGSHARCTSLYFLVLSHAPSFDAEVCVQGDTPVEGTGRRLRTSSLEVEEVGRSVDESLCLV